MAAYTWWQNLTTSLHLSYYSSSWSTSASDTSECSRHARADNDRRTDRQTCYVALDDCHPIGRQRSSLVGTDRRRVTHCLAGVKMPNQVVIMHHFLQQRHTLLVLRVTSEVCLTQVRNISAPLRHMEAHFADDAFRWTGPSVCGILWTVTL